MAILNGIIKKMTGSAGQLTFKTVNGQTVVSEKVTNVKNSRTAGQQRQRMKWVNVIHMYSGIAPLLKNGFEKKMAQQSDYNMFVKLNNSAAPVYLTKTDADGGACIAAPYQITQGSLPSIVISGEGAEAKTDIALGELSIDASTTVAEFSKAVVDSNPDYDYGDQLSFYNVLQRVNAETHIPYCNFSASYVVLDKDSAVKLWDLVNKAGFASVDGMLAHGDDEGDGVFAWVHSRYDNGKTKVSTQYLINNNSILDDYKTDEAYVMACKSYGGVSNVFLQPDGSGSISQSGNAGSNGSNGGTGGSGGIGHGSHQMGLAGGVAGIDHHGQMGQVVQYSHSGQVQSIAGGGFKGADAPLAEDYVFIALAHDVLRAHEQLLNGIGKSALQQNGLSGLAKFLQKIKILHIPGAHLNHIHIREQVQGRNRHQLCHNWKAGGFLGFQ